MYRIKKNYNKHVKKRVTEEPKPKRNLLYKGKKNQPPPHTHKKKTTKKQKTTTTTTKKTRAKSI